ncbi:hypothetical protein BKA59DRAFT_313137 [Fusarium tricinctum]|uniref:Uncharacterized protein n=1 Tax=Fusarium tricinctum TaxID=61284 RepID=A0A8K0RL98_9HYPO|nr:hypothetical protein BKA59DRAFT_313137 [Fusarium tricinctum]
MNTFQIVIKNKYGADKRFLLLQAIPSPTNGPSGDVFTNVYQRSPKIQSGESSVQFAMQQEYFAIIGTASKSDDGTHRVYTNSSLPIKFGPGGTIATVTTQDNDPMWDVNVTAGKTTAIKGGFAIVTDNSFTTDNPNPFYVGTGARDPSSPDSVIPLQTWVAEPGLNTQVYPKPKYYICTGEYQPGMVIDPSLLANVLTVDFTSAIVPQAVFTLSNNGTYVPDSNVQVNGIKWSYGPMGSA